MRSDDEARHRALAAAERLDPAALAASWMRPPSGRSTRGVTLVTNS
jgi:hypothetical protein